MTFVFCKIPSINILIRKNYMQKIIELSFKESNLTNIFRNKSNKTLQETILTNKYIHLKSQIEKYYKNFLDLPIGEFLYQLKSSNDTFYQKFLNPYGDLTYSNFCLKNKEDYDLKGVYFYYVKDELKYIGRCKDSMKKRVNVGYGKISAKNCFKDGQSTNCKINNLVTQYKDDVVLKILVLEDDEKIKKMEVELINKHKPKWNGRQDGK